MTRQFDPKVMTLYVAWKNAAGPAKRAAYLAYNKALSNALKKRQSTRWGKRYDPRAPA